MVVRNVTSVSLNLVPWRHTWGHTVGRSLILVSNVTRGSLNILTWRNTWGCAWFPVAGVGKAVGGRHQSTPYKTVILPICEEKTLLSASKPLSLLPAFSITIFPPYPKHIKLKSTTILLVLSKFLKFLNFSIKIFMPYFPKPPSISKPYTAVILILSLAHPQNIRGKCLHCSDPKRTLLSE